MLTMKQEAGTVRRKLACMHFLHFTFASGIGRTPGWVMRVVQNFSFFFQPPVTVCERASVRESTCTYESEN